MLNSALTSKINWTQVIGIAAQVGAYVGLDVSPEQQIQIAATLFAVQTAATVIFRTWFTGTASAK